MKQLENTERHYIIVKGNNEVAKMYGLDTERYTVRTAEFLANHSYQGSLAGPQRLG